MIYFTSDLHFGHNKDFIYKERGFQTLEEMELSIASNFYNTLKEEDTLYILGDLLMGTTLEKINPILRLPCEIKIVIGNHDTITRINYYSSFLNVKIIGYADLIKIDKTFFYLSHYPTIVDNGDTKPIYNLFGHTHQKDNFYQNNYRNYHIGVDSHNCQPVPIEQIIKEIKHKKYGGKKNDT